MSIVVVGVAGFTVALILILRRLASLERALLNGAAAIRLDIAAMHASHEHTREGSDRALADLERASATAANEVRMAAGTLQELSDALTSHASGATCALR